jgi:hypothetical protein
VEDSDECLANSDPYIVAAPAGTLSHTLSLFHSFTLTLVHTLSHSHSHGEEEGEGERERGREGDLHLLRGGFR